MSRDRLLATKIATLQGTISFDKNGDLASRIISMFQIKHDAVYPADAARKESYNT